MVHEGRVDESLDVIKGVVVRVVSRVEIKLEETTKNNGEPPRNRSHSTKFLVSSWFAYLSFSVENTHGWHTSREEKRCKITVRQQISYPEKRIKIFGPELCSCPELQLHLILMQRARRASGTLFRKGGLSQTKTDDNDNVLRLFMKIRNSYLGKDLYFDTV